MREPQIAVALAASIEQHITARVSAAAAVDILDTLEAAGFALVRATFCREPRRVPPRSRKAKSSRNPEHLAWIRSLRCVVPGCLCPHVQAAHVRMNTGGGMGLKPPDSWTVPLCAAHHREQHSVGHHAFDAKYGIDLRSLAQDLARKSPHL